MKPLSIGAQRKADALRRLRATHQYLSRACNDPNALMDLDDADTPLYWAFVIGAAKTLIRLALADLGDNSLNDAWNAQFEAERKVRAESVPELLAETRVSGPV